MITAKVFDESFTVYIVSGSESLPRLTIRNGLPPVIAAISGFDISISLRHPIFEMYVFPPPVVDIPLGPPVIVIFMSATPSNWACAVAAANRRTSVPRMSVFT